MSFTQDLESSIDMVDLVSRYTKLKKTWANYKSLCPFPGHNEKTPSFVVSPSKQIGYCFWCHRWWWAIKFIMDIEWCEFKEAVEILSSITWVKVKWIDFQKEKEVKNIYWVFKDIKNYYQNNLSKYPDIKKYLIDRWLNKESLELFDFWYSDSWVELYNYLKTKWYDDDLISKTNVFLDIKSKKDKFIWRIIFPIKNHRWDIVWFAWRILDKWEPKYLNSPASDLYDKSNILYWLFESRSEITKNDYIIITEWYMDAISMHQAWFKNTVCVSGTALTTKHINLIKRLTKKIYLCFDNDKAWTGATTLAIDMLKNKDMEVKVIKLKDAKDPDEAIKKWLDMNNFIKNALTPIWFYIENTKKTDSIVDKKAILKSMLEIIKSYNDNIEKDTYLKEIAEKLDISLDVVYLNYNKARINKPIEDIEYKITKKNISSKDYIIPYCMIDESYIDIFKKEIILKDFLDDIQKTFLEEGLSYISKIPLEKKEFYKALSSKLDDLLSKETLTRKEIEVNKFINKLNTDLYKEAEKNLTKEIKDWNKEAEKKYIELLKTKKSLNW